MTGSFGFARRLVAMALLCLCALLALMAQLAPLGPLPDAPMPDLFWCVLAFFCLRKPEAAPLLLVLLLLLLRDALLGGPLGAGALSLLLASETLRWRAANSPGPRPLWTDWLAASFAYGAALALQWLMMALTLSHPPQLLALVPHALTTALALPFVAGFLRYVLRLGASPRDGDGARRESGRKDNARARSLGPRSRLGGAR